MKNARRRGHWRVFRWPLLTAVLSLIGLVAALVGDGVYDGVSWVLLGGLVAVMAAAWRGRPPA